jgi:Raf kinase inhibitor-like YbhB/YbcL family protein
MMKHLAPALLLTALASCGSAGKDNPMNDSTTVAQFTMTSSDIKEGQPIDPVHTCDGADQSPQLSWPEAPPGTRSFALIVDDPDAPSGNFRHWGAYDIPPTTRSIERGQSIGKQAVNGFGNSGYGGPCPPKGHGVHHYRFKLYALGVDGLAVPADAKVEQVEQEAQRHQVGLAQITGTYERK